jgi:hypothetical protein
VSRGWASLTVLLVASFAHGQMDISAGGAAVPNPNIAAFPAPPAGAVLFNNLQTQAAAAWTSLGGISCCGGSSNAGTVTTNYVVASPSITGNSVYLASTGSNYNVQTFTPQGCARFAGGVCTSFSHLTADAYIYINATLQATEGPDVVIYTGSWQLYPSIQCGTNSGSSTPNVSTWNVWGNASGWVSTNISCVAFLTNTGVWQHIQWSVDLNMAAATPTMTYNKLFVRNAQVFSGLGLTYAGTAFAGGANFKPQIQVDALTAAGGFYIDAFNVATY